MYGRRRGGGGGGLKAIKHKRKFFQVLGNFWLLYTAMKGNNVTYL